VRTESTGGFDNFECLHKTTGDWRRADSMDLKREIDSIGIIDDHQHGMDPFYWKEALGAPPPFPPEVHGLEIPSETMHAGKARKLMDMFRALYDFRHTAMTEENRRELQGLYDRNKNDEAPFYHRVMDLAGIETALEVCLSRPVLPPGLQPERFKPIALIDGFLIPLENSGLKSFNKKAGMFLGMAESFSGYMQKELNGKTDSFDAYLEFLSNVIDVLHQRGFVALKSSSGYWRSLEFEWVTEDEARKVFDSRDASPGAYKRLQDYLLKYILIRCGEKGLVFQMHSGAGGVEGFARENDPSLFDRFLWQPEVSATKVVILHGGFPYCREAGFMVAGFGRRPRPVYLDTSIMWMDHPTPNAASLVRTLREWLELGLASKLIYGSDATSFFKLWISAVNFREDLHTALKGMVDDRLIDEDQALSMARQILRGNAQAVYGV
jgi:uncharacterized protein